MSKVFLKNIAEIQSGPFGTQLHKDEYVEKGVLMLNAKNIGNGVVLTESVDYVSENVCSRLSQYVLQDGDILFGRAGSIERHTYIDKRYAGCFQGTNCIRIRCNNQRFSRFVSYYLWLPIVKRRIENQTGGSILSYITTDLLKEIEIDLPNELTVDRITKTLAMIDRRIQNNKAINDNLEQQLYLLYDYWFTQFDFPDANGKPYRSSGGQMVWNNELKRNIPENWYVVPLGEVSSFRNGINYDKNTSGDTTYHIVNVRNISSSSILLDERGLDEICLPCEQAKKYIVSSESILIARSGIPGAPRILYDPSEDIIFCGFIICATPTDSILQHYLTLFLKQLEGSTATQTGGSILKNVSQDTLRNLLVPIPSKDVLTQFNRRVALIYQFMHNHQKETSKLQDLRNWLLPMLMNGQATVIE